MDVRIAMKATGKDGSRGARATAALAVLACVSVAGCGAFPSSESTSDAFPSEKTGRAGEALTNAQLADNATRRSAVAIAFASTDDKGKVIRTGRVFCTGILIAPRVVVTAAHCIIPHSGAARRTVNTIVVRSGLELGNSARKASTNVISEIVTHESYTPYDDSPNASRPDRSKAQNDIALLVLATRVYYTMIYPIVSPESIGAILTGFTSMETTLDVAGYGNTEVGEDAGPTDQRLRVGTALYRARYGADYLTDIVLAGVPSTASCIRPGDSGAPIYTEFLHETRLIAMATAGEMKTGTYGQATILSTYITRTPTTPPDDPQNSWIEKHSMEFGVHLYTAPTSLANSIPYNSSTRSDDIAAEGSDGGYPEEDQSVTDADAAPSTGSRCSFGPGPSFPSGLGPMAALLLAAALVRLDEWRRPGRR